MTTHRHSRTATASGGPAPGGDVISVGEALEVLVELVSKADAHLTRDRLREVIAAAVSRPSTRRTIASTLRERPELLRTGRPPAPGALSRLLVALRRSGAADIALPRCGECDQEYHRVSTLAGGSWICSSCYQPSADCASCGRRRAVTSRDRHGDPRCKACPDTADDPTGPLIELVTGLEPALTAATVTAAVDQAAKRPAIQCRLGRDVLAHPQVLTSQGDRAPTRAVLRFIDALVAAGATTVIRPACGRCGNHKPLRNWRNDRRVCDLCFARTGAEACCRCGNVRAVSTRDPETGAAVCASCRPRQASRHERCRGCGRPRRVEVRLDDGPRCPACRPRESSTCESCGRISVCSVSRATGQNRCRACQARWADCSGCGIVGPQHGGTVTAPLCARCVNPDPEFWGRCPVCAITWQLNPQPCQRCTLARRVRDVLGDAPELESVRRALIEVDRPASAQRWLSRPRVSLVLSEFARGQRSLSHQQLDELPATPALAHLRTLLVTTRALPARDERLATLESWIHAVIAARTDATERRALHGYAIWNHLRRLRQRVGDRPITCNQDRHVRSHVQAAVALLDWLTQHDSTLGRCTQAHLDQWASHPGYRRGAAGFLRWAIKHRHASRRLTLPATDWVGPTGPHHSEQRWDDARRLLHDTDLDTADRVAGLLMLLYAQRLDAVASLTINDIADDRDHVTLALGEVPVVLPDPLDGLVRELVSKRRVSRTVQPAADEPWLFPGRRPGQHLTAAALGNRLQRIGLRPDRDRATALFDLAGRVDAPILARTLGISIKAAARWQHAAAGDWMTYATDLARRTQTAVPHSGCR